jgi:chromosome segregation ATPase
MSQRIFKKILLALVVGASFYSLYSVFGGKWSQIYNDYFPCKKAVTYSIVSFDSRFDISKKDFLTYLGEAEAIWEKPTERDLFTYKDESNKANLEINLVYDYRQEATAKLHALGITVSDTKHSYDTLKSKYQSMQKNYLRSKTEYESKSSDFETKQKEYNQRVEKWNSKGGAPKDVFQELTLQAQKLKEELTILNSMETDLNKKIDDINALVTVINRLAKTLNLNASELNTIGLKTRGEEFTQGEYKSGPEGQAINIYEFSTKEKLIRVLAHELGHALGLGHVEDPDAVMYRLNESKNENLTADDIVALKKLCKID